MIRVLIVDDEAEIRRMLRKWVEAESAEVVEAATAEEAMAAMAKMDVPAGVALCDLRLPGKDGFWLAEQLEVSYPDTAVVMTTGVHDFDAAVTSLRTGAVDYVVKPFTRERVVEALQRAVFAHISRQSNEAVTQELELRRAQLAEALGVKLAGSGGS